VSVDQTAEAQRKFDLGEYIHSVLISLRHQLKGTSLLLKSELEEGILVETYPGAVAQVVTNLFMNSKKHGFENALLAGTISLILKKTASGFSLIIEDDGHGATKEVMNHVFDPFFTTSRGKGGSGLGMHIVYNIVTQKLHWTIRLESEPEQGFRAIMQPTEQAMPIMTAPKSPSKSS
jgi:signal transduction histidine kinase